MGTKNSKAPLHVEVYSLLFDQIRNGEYGEKLPSEMELAEKLNVSRTTLRQALLVLQEDHIIYKKRGSGTYINQNIDHLISKGIERFASVSELIEENQAEKAVISDFYITLEQADELTAEALRIDKGTAVYVMGRSYSVEGEIIAHGTDFIPKSSSVMEKFHSLNSEEEFIFFVEEYMTEQVIGAEVDLVATIAGTYFSKIMGISASMPLLLMNQVLLDKDREPIGLNKTYFNSTKSKVKLQRKKD